MQARVMPKEIIRTPEAPQSPMYSQAVKAGNTIYVAGTTGIDVTTGHFAGTTVKAQARQALLNCQAILRAGGAELGEELCVLRGATGIAALGAVFQSKISDEIGRLLPQAPSAWARAMVAATMALVPVSVPSHCTKRSF